MTPEQILEMASRAIINNHSSITLVLPRHEKAPDGFPRGTLLNDQNGQRTYSYDAQKVCRWVTSNWPDITTGGEHP